MPKTPSHIVTAWFIYTTVAINSIGFSLMLPLIPFYAREFHATPLQIGLLIASYPVAQFFVSPILGRFSDRHGRKPVLLASLFLGSITALSMGFAHSLLMLFAARTLHGVVGAGVVPVARASLADVTSSEERVVAIAHTGASQSIGQLIGPVAGSLLVGIGDIHLPFYVAAGVSLLNMIIGFIFIRETLTERAPSAGLREGLFHSFTLLKHIKSNIGILLIILFIWQLTTSLSAVSFPLLIHDKFGLGARHIGYFVTAAALVTVATQSFGIARLIPLLRERKMILFGLIIMAGTIVLLPLSPAVPMLAIVYMVSAFGGAIARSTTHGTTSRLSTLGQGATMGLLQSFDSLGRIIGPSLGGLLYGISYYLPFSFSAGILLICVIVASQVLSIPSTKQLQPNIMAS